MTTTETALTTALAAVVSYRVGWAIGARRMARAISGRPVGLLARFDRRRRDKTLKRFAEEAAARIATLGDEGKTPSDVNRGQYL